MSAPVTVTVGHQVSYTIGDEWLPAIAAVLDLVQRVSLGLGQTHPCFWDGCPAPSAWLVLLGFAPAEHLMCCQQHLIPTVEVRAVERKPARHALIVPLPGPKEEAL